MSGSDGMELKQLHGRVSSVTSETLLRQGYLLVLYLVTLLQSSLQLQVSTLVVTVTEELQRVVAVRSY